MNSSARVLQPLTSVNVANTLTAMMAARDLSPFQGLLFAFLNDGAALVTILLEWSEDGTVWDGENQSVDVLPAQQRSLVVGPGQLRSFYRISGTAASGTQAVRYIVKGEARAEHARPGRVGVR